MKKIISIVSFILIVVSNTSGQGKGFNSPNNYMGSRPEFKDTLIINLEQGEKIEFIYRWFDLFREDAKKNEKYFWKPFQDDFHFVSKQLTHLTYDDDKTYFICSKRERDQNTDLDKTLLEKMKNERIGAKKKSRKVRDSLKEAQIKQIMKRLFHYKKTLSIQEKEHVQTKKEYLIKNNQLVAKKKWQHIICIDHLYWKVNFYINSLSSLEKIDLSKIKDQINIEKDNFLTKRYYQSFTKLHYRIEDDTLSLMNPFYFKKKKRTRRLSLNLYPMAGTSILKGELSADMGLLVGLNFNHKQNGAMRLGLRYQLKVFGNDESSHYMHTSRFIDGIVDFNIAKSYQKENWIGAGVGYMVGQSGRSIYDDRTARIFIKYRSSMLWGVQPEFNYSFHRETGFIGLGIFFSL